MRQTGRDRSPRPVEKGRNSTFRSERRGPIPLPRMPYLTVEISRRIFMWQFWFSSVRGASVSAV